MSVYLLDVNVLLAMTDSAHAHYEAAHRWFESVEKTGWATCPLTENSFVRILSHPTYPNRPGDAAAVLTILRQQCTVEGHHFWADDVTLRDVLRPGAVITHAQIADLYLLGLAVHHRGKLATFDRRISPVPVMDGDAALDLIPV